MKAPPRLLSEGEYPKCLAFQGGPDMETWMRGFDERFIITMGMARFLLHSSKLLRKRRYELRHIEGLGTYFKRLKADLKRFRKWARKAEDLEDVARIRGNISALRQRMTSWFICSFTGQEMAVY
ncbi:uncharacterized protein FMAN_15490 [Fusarium mangiferae]|uniref:Uncharacterized protein n=1 Tax=Fusarium mangiferae TaxID=192010 RepID=A0A1L7UPR7_FUSMA|nr:uncharacterized protein FMAN_15490 [Fusarium mangiferae]CVL09326.1 uncharacterized protein FMAN_15490 [Fusarium mangiferae]